MTSNIIQGQNHSSTTIYEPILMKICMNAIIMKTQFFIKLYMTSNVIFMLWRSFMIFLLNIDPRSYENFCHYFNSHLLSSKLQIVNYQML